MAEKFAALRDSGLVINKHLAAGETWNFKELMRHQAYLADLAVRAWPMPWQSDTGPKEQEQSND